ncbi:hypothetical protein RUND412_005523 [Rhizina undulata]
MTSRGGAPFAKQRVIKHAFEHYPQLSFPATDVVSHHRPLPSAMLCLYHDTFLECIDPLLKHFEKSWQVTMILTTFSSEPASRGIELDPWKFIENMACLFPELIFVELERTIIETRGKDPGSVRRNEWVRERLKKDLKRTKQRLKEFREKIASVVGGQGELARDHRLTVMDYVLKMISEERTGRSVKSLLKTFKMK